MKLGPENNPLLCANGAKKHCRIECDECKAIQAEREAEAKYRSQQKKR